VTCCCSCYYLYKLGTVGYLGIDSYNTAVVHIRHKQRASV